MKLAIVCRPFTFHGGVETATAGLLGELVRRGHEVQLVTTAAQRDLPGVAVTRLRIPAQPSALRLVAFALAARRAVDRSHCDLVQSHERTLRQDVYRAGEGTHRGYLEAMGRGWRLAPYHRLVCAFERRIFSLETARHIVAISDRDRREIRARYGTPADAVSVIYNGVDLDRFHPDNRARFRADARRRLGLADGDWVVLFVGSGFERKGLGPLIGAMAQLGDRQWRLVVAGKGRRESYEQRAAAAGIASRIRWLPPEPDVERLYAMADVVALPSLYEPFGNVHLEALASGVPVLTTRRAGGAEVIRHGESGWIAAEPRAPDLVAGLDALRQLDATRAASAARKAAEPFTYGAQVDALVALWARLLRPGAR